MLQSMFKSIAQAKENLESIERAVQVRGACAGLPHTLSACPMLVSVSSTAKPQHVNKAPNLALALCPRALIARYRVLHLLHLALCRERVAQVVGEGLEDIARLFP